MELLATRTLVEMAKAMRGKVEEQEQGFVLSAVTEKNEEGFNLEQVVCCSTGVLMAITESNLSNLVKVLIERDGFSKNDVDVFAASICANAIIKATEGDEE